MPRYQAPRKQTVPDRVMVAARLPVPLRERIEGFARAEQLTLQEALEVLITTGLKQLGWP